MCHVCGRQNHLNNARMGGRSPRPQPEETDGACDEQQSAAFDELCILTMTSNASDSAEDLIPVSMNMKAANDEGIRILWAAVVRFAGNSNDTRREANSSDGEMRILEEMAVDDFPELRIGMPESICGFH
ncbi:unnamed protein product [Arctogadus glacialis]